MDAVEELENRIGDLLLQQQRPRISRQVYWQLQEEIDVLDMQAKAITAQQREEPRR